MHDLAAQIKSFFKGDVETDDATLKTYSHDTSLFEIKPKIVVFPRDDEDVQKLVAFVAEKKKDYPELSITGRSGGTDMSGGAINDSIICDFSKYINDIGVVHQNGTDVEPGAFYRDFEKKTMRKHLYLPSYPASRSICALGGMINNNSGGEKSLVYGKTIDYVKELKVVLSDGKEYTFERLNKLELDKKMKQNDFEGEIYRRIYKIVDEHYDLIKDAKPKVSKNSTGYNIWDVWDKEYFDLTKLIVGSQGTLAMTTSIRVKLVPVKKYTGMLIIYVDQLDLIPEIIQAVNPTNPDSFEAFDKYTMRLAIQFMFKFVQLLGIRSSVKMGLHFLPSLIKFATGGIPEFTLMVEYAGSSNNEIHQKIQHLYQQLSKYNVQIEIAKNRQEANDYWVIRRESFNLLRKNIKDKHTAPFIDDFIVPPDCLVEFFPKLKVILEKYHLLYTIAGHMGNGNFHIIPLMNLEIPSERAKILDCANEVYDLVKQYHGSFSAEHNDGLIRGPFLPKQYSPEMIKIFKEIKHIFDPEDIFNPHKKIDANFEFLKSHIRTGF